MVQRMQQRCKAFFIGMCSALVGIVGTGLLMAIHQGALTRDIDLGSHRQAQNGTPTEKDEEAEEAEAAAERAAVPPEHRKGSAVTTLLSRRKSVEESAEVMNATDTDRTPSLLKAESAATTTTISPDESSEGDPELTSLPPTEAPPPPTTSPPPEDTTTAAPTTPPMTMTTTLTRVATTTTAIVTETTTTATTQTTTTTAAPLPETALDLTDHDTTPNPASEESSQSQASPLAPPEPTTPEPAADESNQSSSASWIASIDPVLTPSTAPPDAWTSQEDFATPPSSWHQNRPHGFRSRRSRNNTWTTRPASESSAKSLGQDECSFKEGSGAWDAWRQFKLSAFIYDWTTFPADGAKELDKHAPKGWYKKYMHWSGLPNELIGVDPEYADPYFQSELRWAITTRWKNIQIVDDPNKAQIVFWLIWDYALCSATGAHRLRWEELKGRYSASCHAHWRLLEWLETTPRWRRHKGRDFVVLMVDPHSVQTGRGGGLIGTPWPPMTHDSKAVVLKKVTQHAVMLSTEDRRGYDARGNSWIVSVPYNVRFSHAYAPTTHDRSTLLAFAGSVKGIHHACDACLNDIHPKDLRQAMVNQMNSGCREDECALVLLEKVVHDRNNPMARVRHHLDLHGMLKNSTFCAIPRGDSAGTKRFFASVMAGCIPVIISDHLALPFAHWIDYDKATVKFTESRVMQPSFNLPKKLRRIPRAKVRRMQLFVDCLRRALVYSHGCRMPWTTPASASYCHQAENTPPDAMDYTILGVLRAMLSRKVIEGRMPR